MPHGDKARYLLIKFQYGVDYALAWSELASRRFPIPAAALGWVLRTVEAQPGASFQSREREYHYYRLSQPIPIWNHIWAQSTLGVIPEGG